MTTIALLGATGHVAKGLAVEFLGREGLEVLLYARRPEAVKEFFSDIHPQGAQPRIAGLDSFGLEPCDVVVNAIGVGDPARVEALGADILTVTEDFDRRVLDYQGKNPGTLYVFLSSGAVYGTAFDEPADEDSRFSMPVNRADSSYYYGLSKLVAEARHRAMAGLDIVDLRVFSYFSRFIDLNGRFFMAELARALVDGDCFITTSLDLVRDTVTPADLAALIGCCVERWRKAEEPVNAALDVYSLAPVGKFELLDRVAREFSFRHEVREDLDTLAPTGAKSLYFSTFHKAGEWGYRPRFTSEEGIVSELSALLAGADRRS